MATSERTLEEAEREIDALRKVCQTLEGEVDATAVVVDWGEGPDGNLRLTVTCPSTMDEEQIGHFIASNVNLLTAAADAMSDDEATPTRPPEESADG